MTWFRTEKEPSYANIYVDSIVVAVETAKGNGSNAEAIPEYQVAYDIHRHSTP